MGFNIAGIAFDANYENNIEALETQIRFSLTNKKAVTFEDISRNWWDEEGKIGVAFSPTGTLLFCSPDLIQDHIASPQGASFCFAMIDTSGAYAFNYTKNGTILRDVMTVEGNVMTSEGNCPSFETHEEIGENIWAGIEALIGQPFSQFPVEQTAFIFDIKASGDTRPTTPSLEKKAKPEEKPPAKEKRPSFLKRLFGRRNKAAVPVTAISKEAAEPSRAEVKEIVRRAMLQYPDRKENFLDQILELCQNTKNVEKVYLALEPNSKTARHEYILGFELSSQDESGVKSMSRTIKDKFFTDRELFYTSNITNSDLLETIKSKNYPFYVKHQYYAFRELLAQWAIDRHLHAKAVEMTIRTTPIAFFATHSTGYPDDDEIIFPQGGSHMVVVQDKSSTQPFVPIFTDAAAAQASQYHGNKEGIFLFEMSIPDFNSVTRGIYKGRNFILNSSESPMEFFFKL